MNTLTEIGQDPALLKQHAMEGVLRRLAASRHAGALVLRGGLTARLWARPAHRPADDVDFLGLGPSDPAGNAALLRELLALDVGDGVTFHTDTMLTEVIFAETESPGSRVMLGYAVAGREEVLQLDTGFGDPLVPAATWLDYPTLLPGAPARVLAARPELGFAWKVHGLFEYGAGRWRAKDLHDLWLFARHTPLERRELVRAIGTAFQARRLPLSAAQRLLSGGFGRSKGAERKWKALRKKRRDPAIPEGHREVCDQVADFLRPLFAELGYRPGPCASWP